MAPTLLPGRDKRHAMVVLGRNVRCRPHTIVDEYFFARVTIYWVFALVDWTDIAFGIKATDLLNIVQEPLHLAAIESAPIVPILLLGLPTALAFIVLVLWMLLRLGGAAGGLDRHSHIPAGSAIEQYIVG